MQVSGAVPVRLFPPPEAGDSEGGGEGWWRVQTCGGRGDAVAICPMAALLGNNGVCGKRPRTRDGAFLVVFAWPDGPWPAGSRSECRRPTPGAARYAPAAQLCQAQQSALHPSNPQPLCLSGEGVSGDAWENVCPGAGAGRPSTGRLPRIPSGASWPACRS
jgi:hypothetical protein